MDYAYHAHLALERLLPRLEQRFAQPAQGHPADWQAFVTRLQAHFSRLFELTHRIYGNQYDYYYHLEELLAGMAQSWLARPAELKALDAERELREAQAFTASTVPNTGLAVAIDVGDPNDIHPTNKKPVGERLALIALAKEYGKSVVCSGPVYRQMQREGSAIRLSFDHTDGGLAEIFGVMADEDARAFFSELPHLLDIEI